MSSLLLIFHQKQRQQSNPYYNRNKLLKYSSKGYYKWFYINVLVAVVIQPTAKTTLGAIYAQAELAPCREAS